MANIFVPLKNDGGHETHVGLSRSVHGARPGTVRFRDDSVVRIEGCGPVVFHCKNNEHHSFSGVYYIPKLTTNIVRMGSSMRSATTSTSSSM